MSVDGRAEATTLPDHSVSWVTAGQAFHWFEPRAARAEFQRILRPGGGVALAWNERRADATPLARAYEALLLEFGTDYAEVRSRDGATAEVLAAFFAPHGHRVHAFENPQQFDFEGLRGRLLSASYVPTAGHPAYEPMLTALSALFDRHARAGRVTFEQDTRVYVGRMGA